MKKHFKNFCEDFKTNPIYRKRHNDIITKMFLNENEFLMHNEITNQIEYIDDPMLSIDQSIETNLPIYINRFDTVANFLEQHDKIISDPSWVNDFYWQDVSFYGEQIGLDEEEISDLLDEADDNCYPEFIEKYQNEYLNQKLINVINKNELQQKHYFSHYNYFLDFINSLLNYKKNNLKITINNGIITGSFGSDNWEYLSDFTLDLMKNIENEHISVIIREFTPLYMNKIPIKKISAILFANNDLRFLDGEYTKSCFDESQEEESFIDAKAHIKALKLDFL